MIAHVAEAGENRGRVIVRLGAFAEPEPAALAAAIHVARAFQSEIEGLFIEDPDLFAAAAHPFVRELSLTGAGLRPLSLATVEHDCGHFAVATQRRLARLAEAAAVRFEARVVRDTVVGALTTACGERGPWNIIVFAEPVLPGTAGEVLSVAVAGVWGTTGYLVAAPRALWRRGPILVAIEDTDRLTGMVRAGQRLAAVAGEEVIVVPVGADDIAVDWLEAEMRLMLGEAPGVRVLPRPCHTGHGPALRTALAGHAPRLVIARYGGLTVPAGDPARPLAELAVPVFLVH
jgi:hypothetical protein